MSNEHVKLEYAFWSQHPGKAPVRVTKRRLFTRETVPFCDGVELHPPMTHAQRLSRSNVKPVLVQWTQFLLVMWLLDRMAVGSRSQAESIGECIVMDERSCLVNLPSLHSSEEYVVQQF